MTKKFLVWLPVILFLANVFVAYAQWSNKIIRKAAKQIGLTISPNVRVWADKVIR